MIDYDRDFKDEEHLYLKMKRSNPEKYYYNLVAVKAAKLLI